MRQLSGRSLVRHLPCIGLDPYRALVHLLGPAEDMECVAASDTLKEDDADGPDIEGRLHVEFRSGCVSEDGLRGRIAESAARTAVSSCTYKVPDERPIFFIKRVKKLKQQAFGRKPAGIPESQVVQNHLLTLHADSGSRQVNV
jgi:hypothetical protein